MKLVDLNKLQLGLSKFITIKAPRKVILVRNCESQGNLAGTITGWMDVPLTDFGRKQAFKLSECLADLQVDSVSSSDLQRSIDTAFYAMAFPNSSPHQSKHLREINFGTHEGLHFDNLPKAEKQRFSDPNFKANEGESWDDVRSRA